MSKSDGMDGVTHPEDVKRKEIRTPPGRQSTVLCSSPCDDCSEDDKIGSGKECRRDDRRTVRMSIAQMQIYRIKVRSKVNRFARDAR